MSLTTKKSTRAETLKKRYGENYFKELGRKGGKNSPIRGFSDPEIARKAGKKSKRKSLQA